MLSSVVLAQGTAFVTLRDRLASVTSLHAALGSLIRTTTRGAEALGSGESLAAASPFDVDAAFAAFDSSQARTHATLSSELRSRSVLLRHKEALAAAAAAAVSSAGGGAGSSGGFLSAPVTLSVGHSLAASAMPVMGGGAGSGVRPSRPLGGAASPGGHVGLELDVDDDDSESPGAGLVPAAVSANAGKTNAHGRAIRESALAAPPSAPGRTIGPGATDEAHAGQE